MTPQQLEATNRAIKALGGLTKIAKRYGITVPAVQQWRKNGVPQARVNEVAQDSGVPREALLPHIYA